MIRECWSKLRRINDRRRLDEGLREEMAAHLEMEVEENLSRGMSPESAVAAARRGFGNTTLIHEEARETWMFRSLEAFLHDAGYAIRGFRHAPGFALAVIGTLALGLGALAAAFSIFNAMVLRPFPVRDPHTLYAFTGWGQLSYVGSSWKERPFTWREFQDFRRDNPAFSEVVGYQNGAAMIEERGASIQAVTGNYFTMLGGRICMGRGLLESDDESGEGVGVASYPAWKSRFGADPGIIGRRLPLGGKAVQIVGVACPEFSAPQLERVDLWVSLALSRELEDLSTKINPGGPLYDPSPEEFPKLSVIGRLRPGMTKESAEAALLAYGKEGYRSWRNWNRPPERASIEPRASSIPLNRASMTAFSPLLLAFGLVLLITCANVSNMMMVRGLARRREIGIRISLGAGRARVVRQLFVESLLLAILAAIAAFGVAYGIIRAGYWLLMSAVPSGGWQQSIVTYLNLPDFLPDFRVMVFLIATALFTTLIFGLVPAVQTTHSDLVQANRAESEAGHRRVRLRSVFVVVQVTLCTLLLILSGVSMRNKGRISSLDLGLDNRGVFKITTSEKYRQPVMDRLSSLSSTNSIATGIKPSIGEYPEIFHPTYFGENKDAEVRVTAFPVSPEYFDVFKIRVRGRKFPIRYINLNRDPWDGMEVVITETAARRLFPSGDALGRILESRNSDRRTGKTIINRLPVVGIAQDSVGALYDSAGRLSPNRMVVYWLEPPVAKHLSMAEDQMIVRMMGNPGSARLLLQKELEEVVAGGMHFQLSAVWEELDRVLYPYRIVSAITAFVGGMALLLTTSGVFGMLSYVVAQRRKEFGIRIALGAGRSQVTGMVLRQSLRLAMAGSLVGALLAFGLARVMAQSVYRFDLLDPGGFAAGILTVVAAALGAAWIPATRAVNRDPARTLHCE